MITSTGSSAVESRAPVRINDLGGWTDTWFSGHGRVLSVAVSPGVDCRLAWTTSRPPRRKAFTIDVRDFGERYSFNPDNPDLGRHPLLEATVASMNVPRDVAAEAVISSRIPAGCGTGTSAAVTVALIGALDAMTEKRLDRESVWKAAHRVETERLGWESGIQDQVCATYGGVCFIDIHQYPDASVSRLELNQAFIEELEKRLVLVYLGTAHKSTDVHKAVIQKLVAEGSGSAHLAALREFPSMGRKALADGDLFRYGNLMIENTECQRSLHPRIISPEADSAIETARGRGAIGWKVNGAGGTGGSLTVLAGEETSSIEGMIERLSSSGGGVRVIPVRIDHEGLRVKKTSF